MDAALCLALRQSIRKRKIMLMTAAKAWRVFLSCWGFSFFNWLLIFEGINSGVWWITPRRTTCRDYPNHNWVEQVHDSGAGRWSPRTWRYEPALLDQIDICVDKRQCFCSEVPPLRTPRVTRSPPWSPREEDSLVPRCKVYLAISVSPIRLKLSRSNVEWTSNVVNHYP